MFSNIIVGIDGQAGGRDALALARALLAQEGRLHLAYVYRTDSITWRGSNADFEAFERDEARDVLAQARESAGVSGELCLRGAPTVGRGLHELAEDLEADLIVVGSSRRGLFDRVLIGDDTRAALNGAPCAVAIAPAGLAEHPQLVREVGVGYDGSPESEHALEFARGLAAEQGAKLSAFQAVYLPYRTYVGPAFPDQGTLTEIVDEARTHLSALGGVEGHAAYGQPAEELAIYSASLDLLVIGSRGHGPVGRLVHGSTAQQLARTARCPLLVLTRANRRPPAARDHETAGTGAVA